MEKIVNKVEKQELEITYIKKTLDELVEQNKKQNEQLTKICKGLAKHELIFEKITNLESKQQEALKRAAEAEGIAQKKRIEAQGKADAVTIEAKAQAKANLLVSKSLTDKLLHLEQIKVQGKFNEALRDNKDARIFLTPGGSTPNIWVDTQSKSRQSSMK